MNPVDVLGHLEPHCGDLPKGRRDHEHHQSEVRAVRTLPPLGGVGTSRPWNAFFQEKCSWEIQMNRQKKEELKHAQQQQGGHHQQDGQKSREGQKQQGNDPGKSGQPTRHQFRPDDTD
jgi:hypothetical protein